MSNLNANGLIARGSPKIPFWFNIIRYVTILLSIGVLAAAAYHLSLFGNNTLIASYSGPAGFLIFDSIWTWLILGSMLVLETFFQALYFRIIYVVALSLAAIFWLSAWAWAASAASSYNSVYGDYYGYGKFGHSMAAGAGLGAICWILIIVILVFYIMFSLRSSESTVTQAELGQVHAAEVKPGQQPIVTQSPEQHQQQQEQQQYTHTTQQTYTQQYPPQQEQTTYQQHSYVEQPQQQQPYQQT